MDELKRYEIDLESRATGRLTVQVDDYSKKEAEASAWDLVESGKASFDYEGSRDHDDSVADVRLLGLVSDLGEKIAIHPKQNFMFGRIRYSLSRRLNDDES